MQSITGTTGGNWNKDLVLEAVKKLLLIFLGLGMELDYIGECHNQ